MEKDPGAFTVSQQVLTFHNNYPLKIVVKNTSLRSTSYDIANADDHHFKLIGHRIFTLAPGISKTIQIKHIQTEHCKKQEKHKKIILINNSFGKSQFFTCICPNFSIKKQEQLIEFPSTLQINQFNKKTACILPIINNSQSNLKLFFDNMQLPHFSVKILNQSLIILARSMLNIDVEVFKNQYGIIDETMKFSVTKEEQITNGFTKKDFIVRIKGDCVNKSLVIRDQDLQINQIKVECLNGTNKEHYFYIQNMFNRSIQYFLTVSLDADSPSQYAKKWRSSSIIFTNNQGILNSRKKQKISFKIKTQYNENDQNYVRKYNKIGYTDEKSANILRNSNYYRKNIEFTIKINFKNVHEKILPTIIPIKCTIVNPSIRYRILENKEKQTKLEIINQSRIVVPFKFSQHSLYRTSVQKGDLNPKTPLSIIIKWIKANEKCQIYTEIPDFNILIYDPKECSEKGTITRPASRRPMTSEKLFRERFNRETSRINTRPISGVPFMPISSNIQKKKAEYMKPIQILPELPKSGIPEPIPSNELDCIVMGQGIIKNTHLQHTVILQIIGEGYLKLRPGQSYSFDEDWKTTIEFRILGHDSIFKINPIQQKFFFSGTNFGASKQSTLENINNRSKQAYKILIRELQMSFKDNHEEFQIIDFIPIKNYSNQYLKVNCLTLDGEFFHCKEPGNHIIVPPNQIGKFKISFMPKNIISLRALANQPPKDSRRKAVVHTAAEMEFKEQTSKVRKEIKFLINKKIELIKCVGEILQKRCTIRPENIQFTNCKYGSAETVQNFVITCLSSKPLNFFIEHPEDVIVKPKKGSISAKSAQTCSVHFKPSKKISYYQGQIRIYIGGSHTEILPLIIDVEDPEIYIKEEVLQISQMAICDSDNQELNTEMTIVNNSLCQSFIEIDLNQTNLSFGYSKNHTFTTQMGIVQESFSRRAKFNSDLNKAVEILSEKTINLDVSKDSIENKKCLINVEPGSFLKVPLSFKIFTSNQGRNIMAINKKLANLVGFGEISSPQNIVYHCQKTLLHIRPFKQFHDITLTKNQQGYQIQLKNTTKNTIRIRTEIKQIKNQQQDVSLICTYKDINEYLSPEQEIKLNIDFIFFDIEKDVLSAQYSFKIFVAETLEDEKKEAPYHQTQLNVFIPSPFLEVSPGKLIMSTVGLNTWTRGTFFITNHGYKQIFIKIKKPTNIVFDLEYTMTAYDPNQKNKNKQILSRVQNSTPSSSMHNENQLTKMKNCIEVKLSMKSKVPVSYNILLEIQDNMENKYQIFIAGTFTDSPFFVMENLSVNTIQSASSIASAKSFNSNSFLSSKKSIGQKSDNKIKSQLDPLDVEDLLFLNNWLGSLIPELSGESTFFYVWLTKADNFLKFLKQFEVNLFTDKQSKKKNSEPKSLENIFELMKKEGFHLNSLRIQLLEKADQLEWLNFMWFFFSKQIINSNLLTWISKMTNEKVSYDSLSKNYPILIGNLIQAFFTNKDKGSSEWLHTIEKYQPLLGMFKNVQSRRHLILSCNILYHRLNNLKKQVVENSGFEMNLTIENKQNKKVKYFLLCDTKNLNCEESSKKTLPSVIPCGYTITLEQLETVQLLLSFKNIQVIKKIQSISIIVLNNIIWESITLYEVKLKRKPDIHHTVNIQCQQKCSQQWTYVFKSKISSEYRINLQGDSQFKLISSSNLGYLKQGETATLKVAYNPDSVDKHQSCLIISNNLMKEYFSIKGKPLHSRKVSQQTNLKPIQGKQYRQIIVLPWQIKNSKINSLSSRTSKVSPIQFNAQFFSRTMSEITFSKIEFCQSKKEVRLEIIVKFMKKYRNLQVLLRIYNNELNESKIVKLIINVTPKPIFVRGQMEADVNLMFDEISIPNIYKIPENVTIQYQSIENQEEVTKQAGKKRVQYISEDYDYPFEVISHKNGSVVSFGSEDNQMIAEQLFFKIKFNPLAVRENNCAMFTVCLSYSESLLKFHYIFIGTVKPVAKTMKLIEEPKIIKFDATVLRRQRKQIRIHNPKPYTIKFEVSTDLNEIHGDSIISVQKNSTTSYYFDLYCLHCINKSGNLSFLSQQLQYNYQINLNVNYSQNANDKDNNDIRVYRETYSVASKIRQKKILTISLVNSSEKTVEYNVICSSIHLRPLQKTIQISGLSEQSLDIEYFPSFIGQQTALLALYNPYQPEITYTINMISQNTCQKIKQTMPGIGGHKPIRITLENNSTIDTSAQLQSVLFNNTKIGRQQWADHFSLFIIGDKTHKNYTRSSFSLPKSSQLSLNVIFNSLELSEAYSYELVFQSKDIGQFLYQIQYQYPKQQIMTPTILHINENSTTVGAINILNKFQTALTLESSYDSEAMQVIEIENVQKKTNGFISIDPLIQVVIRFRAKPQGKSFNFILITTDRQFRWVYPITIYKVCQLIYQPIILKGITNEFIHTKVYPLNISSLSFIKITSQNGSPISQSLLNLEILQNVIRKKKAGDKNICEHKQLCDNKIYEIQFEIYSTKPMKMDGYVCIYASNKHTRLSNQFNELDKMEVFKISSQSQYIVEKIPIQVSIAESPIKIIQLFANVGQKARAILKFDQFLQQTKTQHPKTLDSIQIQPQTKLINNKGQQFQVECNTEKQQIQITYTAKEYSSLKSAKLQIFYENSVYTFMLIGKYPEK